MVGIIAKGLSGETRFFFLDDRFQQVFTAPGIANTASDRMQEK